MNDSALPLRFGSCQVATNIHPHEYEKFRAIAASHNVTISAYLRAMIVDVLAEEDARKPQ